ncbi:MAG: aldehyde dehydrogenase family protein [Polyangiales bacterium]
MRLAPRRTSAATSSPASSTASPRAATASPRPSAASRQKPLFYAREEVSAPSPPSPSPPKKALLRRGPPPRRSAQGRRHWSASARGLPVGPMLAITPFNFPLNLVAHQLAPTLRAGHPSAQAHAQTPLTAMLLAEVVAEAQRATEGIPEIVLSVLPFERRGQSRWCATRASPALSFTGSDAARQVEAP